jgi:moderate conductance mechanosensitive channel
MSFQEKVAAWFKKIASRFGVPSRIDALKIGLILIVLFISVFASDLFPGTQFALMVERTFGQFFNIAGAFESSVLLLVESFAILVFIWTLIQVVGWFFLLFKEKGKEPSMGVALAQSALKYVLYVTGAVMFLTTWGVDPTAILAAAGLAGIAISFGAQAVIQDIISGVFILIDKPYSVGDIVYVQGFRGLVMKMTLRNTHFKDLVSNDIKIFHNSDIRDVVNTSVLMSTAVAEIGISYNLDIRDVEKIIQEHLPKMKEAIPAIIEGPIYLGITSFGDSSVNLKFIARTNESDKFSVSRLMNRELKILFDERKIEIPFPQVVLTEYKNNPTPSPIVNLTAHQEQLEQQRVKARGQKLKSQKKLDHGSDEEETK